MGRLKFDLQPLGPWGGRSVEEHNARLRADYGGHPHWADRIAPCCCGYHVEGMLCVCWRTERTPAAGLKRLERHHREAHLKALREKRVFPGAPFERAPQGTCWWCGEEMPRTKKGAYVQRAFHSRKFGEANCYHHYLLHTSMPVQLEYLLKRRGPGCAGCCELKGRWTQRAAQQPARLREYWGKANYPADVWVGEVCLTHWLADVEVDHIVALALVAHLPPHERRPYFGPVNLQILCSGCHKRKTREDVRKIRALQAELKAASSPR